MVKALALDATRGIIMQSFAKVFEGLNVATEAQYQRLRLKTVTKERYADYVTRNVGVFPLFGTTQHASVETAYVRIALSDRLERERYRSASDIEAALRTQRAGRAADPAREASARTLLDVLGSGVAAVALVGNPGSGKTTSLRHVAVELAKGAHLQNRRLLPLFLSVRDLAVDARSVEESAVGFLEWLDVVEPRAAYRALLRGGDVAVLLDGVDEAEPSFQAKLLREISKLRADFPKVVICVSGRPHTLGAGLPGFQKWETLPLAWEERLSLVTTWYKAVDEAKGAKLLAECADNPGLLDLGTNPLLLSIVCALYYNDLKIPREPDELYARTVDGLLGAWDAFRNIARHTPLRDLSVRRRAIFVSWLAATMFDRNKLVFSARDVDDTRVLQRYAESTHAAPLDADAVLASLYNDFGILIERAPGLFSFSHLTFHEYLTAQYIVDNRRELEVIRHRTNGVWREVLRLVAKMLPNANIYMAALTNGTDFTNAEDVKLLADAWRMAPVCSRDETYKAMKVVVTRWGQAVRPFRADYAIDGDRLIIKMSRSDVELQKSNAHPAAYPGEPEYIRRLSYRDRAAVLRNAPLITDIFRATGTTLHNSKFDSGGPFGLLLADAAVRTVEIRARS